MAQYSNLKKPALFIPILDYSQSIGNIEYKDDPFNDIHLLNPTKTHHIEGSQDEDIIYDIKLNSNITYGEIADDDNYIYLFILGHNFAKRNSQLIIECGYQGNYFLPTEVIEIINYNNDANTVGGQGNYNESPSHNGFSIAKLNYTGLVTYIDTFRIRIQGFSSTSNNPLKIGSVCLCSKWTPPHNPDLSLKMNREYDGVRSITSKGGATLSNALYTRGGTFWQSNYAWELSVGDYESDSPHLQRQRTLGRRNWDLNFSYLTAANLMPEFESLSPYGTEYGSDYKKNITTSQSFFARVLNRVQGSHIPFIFLANDTDPNYNPDQWAICRFNQKKFDISQKAPELYSMKLKIRESY